MPKIKYAFAGDDYPRNTGSDENVCQYRGCGNTVYPPDYRGRKINDVTQHCGQHRFRRSA